MKERKPPPPPPPSTDVIPGDVMQVLVTLARAEDPDQRDSRRLLARAAELYYELQILSSSKVTEGVRYLAMPWPGAGFIVARSRVQDPESSSE
jgi:hypothetical protein